MVMGYVSSCAAQETLRGLVVGTEAISRRWIARVLLDNLLPPFNFLLLILSLRTVSAVLAHMGSTEAVSGWLLHFQLRLTSICCSRPSRSRVSTPRDCPARH